MLAEDKCHFRKVIHINMDTISGLSEKSSNNDVGALTKSFVFSLLQAFQILYDMLTVDLAALG